jgi:alpha-galactosidase
MGWNSWFALGEHITDQMIRTQADAMIASGMLAAGYQYINVDDGWQGERNSEGALQPNAGFPDMKALGDYLHSRGLKFGIYTSMGPQSCSGHVGSAGHEQQDAQTFANWSVDFIKYDRCHLDTGNIQDEIRVLRFSKALRSSEKHPIVLSIVDLQSPWDWAPPLAVNMWRIAPDATDSFSNVLSISDIDSSLFAYSNPHGWNDPDILQIGHNGMSLEEYRTHMTLWIMLSAPLLAGLDLRNLTQADLELLTNSAAIAINQDPGAKQAQRIQHGALDVWLRVLSKGWAIAVINRSDQTASYDYIPGSLGIAATQTHDVWNKGTVSTAQTFLIQPHGSVLLEVH